VGRGRDTTRARGSATGSDTPVDSIASWRRDRRSKQRLAASGAMRDVLHSARAHPTVLGAVIASTVVAMNKMI
jgi:hypothetical protein